MEKFGTPTLDNIIMYNNIRGRNAYRFCLYCSRHFGRPSNHCKRKMHDSVEVARNDGPYDSLVEFVLRRRHCLNRKLSIEDNA